MGLQDPASDLVPLSRAGGFNTRYSIANIPRTAKGFMLSADKSIRFKMGSGQARTYPAGTFTAGEVYYVQTQQVDSANTDLGANEIYLLIDI